MVHYKTVAGPVGLTIKKKDSFEKAVRVYADIIEKEAVGGWELDCIQRIPVEKKLGCISSLLGRPTVEITFNMLVFKKVDED